MPVAKTVVIATNRDGPYASDSEEDMLAGPSPKPSNGAKRGRGRPKSGEGAAQKAQQTQSHTVKDKDAAKSATGTRGLKKDEVPETQALDDVGDADDFDDSLVNHSSATRVATLPSSKANGPAAKKPKTQAAGKGQGRAPTKDETQEAGNSEGEAQASSSLSRTAAAKKAPRPAKRDTIADTQPDPMDVEQDTPKTVQDGGTEGPDESSKGGRKTAKATNQSTSKKRGNDTANSTSASTSEDLQRRLDEMTKQFETLQAQYNELKEVGIDEAEENYETLRRQMEEREMITNKLITKLKTDVAAATSKTSEVPGLQADLKALREERDALKGSNKKAQLALDAAQAESKTLQAKLAAARSTSEQSKTMPGSAVKGPAARQAATVEAQKDIAKRQLKEDLYGDLTDLIIRDVKRRDETGEDVYDCFQTGRNGTLQFHLSIPNPPPADEAFADVEIGYEPMLDEQRDRQIIEVLPEFAREEICFQRGQAAKFYAQIREAMQKRVEQTAAAANAGMED